MKFLKINAKVLLILCLFSGILFLSTGCGENKEPEKDNNSQENVNNSGEKENNNSGNEETPDKKDNSISKIDTETDYSVWVANTTINTDQNQRSYKVIWGDTLWLISTAWKVPYQEIAAYNNIPNPDLIYVDQIVYNPLFK